MNPGIYFDISNEEYHAGDGVSKSQLDMVALSPALLQWQKSAPVDTEKLKALDMGTALPACCWSRKNLISVSSWRRSSTAARQQAKRMKLRS